MTKGRLIDRTCVSTLYHYFVLVGNKDHSEYNMFACVLSSHGSNQSICGSNGKPVMLIDLMKDIINCKSLKGKPKLFFIDVSR